MKTIGLIGGMSWQSTVTYYQVINQLVKQRLGGLHSAQCLLYSVNFEPIEAFQKTGNWAAAGKVLASAAQAVEKGGADFLLLCTNTMHKVAPAIESAVQIPMLHIADATADKLLADRVGKVALLGTRYTMEQSFYTQRLVSRGIEVMVPPEAARERINQVIFDELCLGVISAASKQFYLEEIQQLAAQGAQGVILGCTEIGLLVSPQDTMVPLYDTTFIHAEAAVDYALAEMPSRVP